MDPIADTPAVALSVGRKGSIVYVRDAHELDLDALCDFVNLLLPQASPPQRANPERLRERWTVLLANAADQGKPCACVLIVEHGGSMRGVLAVEDSGKAVATIDIRMVEVSVWGSIASQLLLNAMWLKLAPTPCRRVEAWVPTSSHRARGALQREGFVRVEGAVREPMLPEGTLRHLYAKAAKAPSVGP